MTHHGIEGDLAAFGWSDRVLALFNDLGEPRAEPARVVRVERGHAVVVCPDGTESLVVIHAPAAVGDWVALRYDAVVSRLPRWSAMVRQDPSGTRVQVLAANVDLVLITAPADRLNAARLERELAVAWDSGARPLVVMTKSELAPAGAVAELADRLAGVDVVPTSAVTGLGVDDIREILRPDRTAALLGPSGAGKSTLANALLGTDRLATGSVRGGDNRGRHTTTSRQLLAVPGGGVLIDTPGLRSLGLPGETTVEQVFPDIDELAARCRFTDCRHEVEPGCAVADAASDGALDTARLANFRKLQGEIAAEVRRTDPLVRRAELSAHKAQVKSMKANDKRTPR
ncbi:MAG: ribosome small subunit-dependent GTPase A [Acidimicrobiales bacterium]